MIRAMFIRHGQSTANVGIFSPGFAQIPLTEFGERQAEELAKRWETVPDLIAVSPFLRAQQTAAPTIARFPDVPVETWDIYEFTYWDPRYWEFGDPESYPEDRARYWRVADPTYRQGDGAESFSMFLQRARDTLKRLAQQPHNAIVLLFSHGHFMQAIRFEVMFPELTDGQKMERFSEFDRAYKVKNTECVVAEFDGTAWHIPAARY